MEYKNYQEFVTGLGSSLLKRCKSDVQSFPPSLYIVVSIYSFRILLPRSLSHPLFSPWHKNNHTQHRACKKYNISRTLLSCSCQYHVGVLCFRGPLWTWWPKHAQKHIMSSRTRQCLGISPGQYRLHGPPKVNKQLPVPVYKPALEFDEVQPIFAAASGKQCCHHHANTKGMIKCWVFISLSLSEHSGAMLLFWFTSGTAKEKLNLKA